MRPRTKRQREILDYIHEFVEKHGYVPSYQQIANYLGVKSKSGIAKHIVALEEKGLLSRRSVDGSFNLELIPQQTVANLVCEIEWLINPLNIRKIKDENLYIPRFLIGYLSPTKLRAFVIEDNAMSDEKICEDDIAIILTKTFARDGEIVAALVKNKFIALRKFSRMGANIELKAMNENYEPIIQPANKIQILGIYKGLLRPLT